MFDVLATAAAGVTEDALQFALLKELVGLRLPGWGRLLVTSLGELARQAAVQLRSVDSSTFHQSLIFNWDRQLRR